MLPHLPKNMAFLSSRVFAPAASRPVCLVRDGMGVGAQAESFASYWRRVGRAAAIRDRYR